MSIGTDLGGIEKSMIDFLKFLSSESDFEIDLYLWRKPGPLYSQIPKRINILPDSCSPKGIRECSSVQDLCRYLSFRILDIFNCGTKSLKKIGKNYDVAIAYCQVGHVPYFIIDKVKAKKKLFFYHHGSYSKNFISRFIDSIYFNQFDSILTMSQANSAMLSKVFPSLQSKIEVWAPIIDSNTIISKSKVEIKEEFLSGNVPTIVTVARLSEEKGIMNALSAAKILHELCISFTWIFIGSGPSHSECNDFINKNGLENHCILVGRKANPYPLVAKADLYVQPSLVESYSITIREAALLNKPIIASAIPALIEAKSNIKNIIYTSLNPRDLANIISAILADETGLKSGKYNSMLKQDINQRSFSKLLNLIKS